MTNKSQDKPLIRESRSNERNCFCSLVLHNDELNTLDFVIESLIEICHHSGVQAEQCAIIAHYKGKSEVKTGRREDVKEMHAGLASRGLISTIEQ